MKTFDKQLKAAIVDNDIDFIKKHRDQYDINQCVVDADNDSLLLYAASYPDSEAYDFFLDNGADTMLVNDFGEGILHAIAYSGLPQRLMEFVNKYPCDLNTRAGDGSTPLVLSIAIKQYEIAKMLIMLGADINIGDNEKLTPLAWTAMMGNLEIVKLLISKGADQHIKTDKGNYPLALAINEDHEDVAKYLFQTFYPFK